MNSTPNQLFAAWPQARRFLADARKGDHRAAQILANQRVCYRCPDAEVRFRWQTIRDGRTQIRVECQRCGRFLCWAPQWPDTVAQADAEEEAEME
jgi:hypothetical protein